MVNKMSEAFFYWNERGLCSDESATNFLAGFHKFALGYF